MRMRVSGTRKIIVAIQVVLIASQALAQGVKLTPLAGRWVMETDYYHNQNADIITDTLTLPFFEDFTENTGGYPSPKLWTDNEVWVNNNFPTGQPNYNVATFDHLDKNGKPYSNLDKTDLVYADSLTSQPIKLDFYKNGINTVNYLPTDSIYLSFFVQQMGLGDQPDLGDSLILFFLTKTGQWVRTWGVTGGTPGDFKEIVVPVDDFSYLHAAFQFRFVNFTKATGNLNHWHLDYIRLEKYKKRTAGNDITNIHDLGITRPSYTMFKNYFSLPYKHYKTDVTGQQLSEHKVTIRNLNTTSSTGGGSVNTQFACEVRNQYNQLVLLIPFSAVNHNINDNSDSTISFSSLKLDTLSTDYPEFNVTYKINPGSDDQTPTEYNSLGNNNNITVKHKFTPWYAYDDGSAEGGFGLDYAYLGNIKGQFAMKFTNLKDDSLRGLSMYFNRSQADVSFRSFSLRIWKALSTIGGPDNKDELLYEFPVDHPIYTDSMNKFVYIFFDTILPLPKGDYYVGWKQDQPYVLNVGYDNNYRYNGQEVGNPNLFYDLLGSWEHADYDVKGVPMIRPLFGLEKDYSFNTKNVVFPEIKVYPNPVAERLFWDTKFPARYARIISSGGANVLFVKEPGNSLNVENLKPGMYTLQLQLRNGQLVSKRIIKN